MLAGLVENMIAQNDVVGIDPDGLGHLQLQGVVQLRPDPYDPVLAELDLCIVQDLLNRTIAHHGPEPGQDQGVVLDQPFQFQSLDFGVEGFQPLGIRDLYRASFVEQPAALCLTLGHKFVTSASARFLLSPR
jgi:hypothetical protein